MEITYCFIGTDKLSLKEFNEKIVSQATEIISKKSNKIIIIKTTNNEQPSTPSLSPPYLLGTSPLHSPYQVVF